MSRGSGRPDVDNNSERKEGTTGSDIRCPDYELRAGIIHAAMQPFPRILH